MACLYRTILQLLLILALQTARSAILSIDDARSQIHRLWTEIVTHNNNQTLCLSSERGQVVNISGGLASLENDAGVLDSVVFYKKYIPKPSGEAYPGQHECIDIQPAQGKGKKADTCEKQRSAGYCKGRLSGAIKDGLCARTCGLCGGNKVSRVGMRATLAFPFSPASLRARFFVTVDVAPTGNWRFHHLLCNSSHANYSSSNSRHLSQSTHSHGSAAVHCGCKHTSSPHMQFIMCALFVRSFAFAVVVFFFPLLF